MRDNLVWTKTPLFLQNELVPIDRVAGERTTDRESVKRLGDEPVVVEFESDTATVQVAARAEHKALVLAVVSPYDGDSEFVLDDGPWRPGDRRDHAT